jgi:integrase
MEKRTICVDKQLSYVSCNSIIEAPKTKKSIRYIPMTDGVYEHMQKAIEERQLKDGIEPVCYDKNGKAYQGFIFLSPKKHNYLGRKLLYYYITSSVDRFNKEHPDKAAVLKPHICRHTFATNMQDLPIKTLQTILGHSSISVTMNTYVKAKPEADQLAEVNAVAKAIEDR